MRANGTILYQDKVYKAYGELKKLLRKGTYVGLIILMYSIRVI